MSMPRSSHRRIAAVALSALLIAAAPSLAAVGSGPAAGSIQDGLLQSIWGVWERLSSLWSALGEEGDAGARIDGNGSLDRAGARIDGNGLTAGELEGDAGARIDGNGAY
jgi:hypothetical protein